MNLVFRIQILILRQIFVILKVDSLIQIYIINNTVPKIDPLGAVDFFIQNRITRFRVCYIFR